MTKLRRPSGYWTLEKVFQESKRYQTKGEFKQGAPSAYKLACDQKLIDGMTWLMDGRSKIKAPKYTKDNIAAIIEKSNCVTVSDLRKANEYACKKAEENGWITDLGLIRNKHDNGYWTKEKVLAVAKTYTDKDVFHKKESVAYKWASHYGLLDKMDWMHCPSYEDRRNDHDSTVYAYIDEANKTVYVGLTIDAKARKASHKHQSNSAVRKYFGKNIPEPIILKDNLTIEESAYYEDFFKKQYIEEGYTLLNVAATGVNVSSIGGIAIWTSKEKVFEESRKYHSRSEFKKKAGGAYNHAKENNWLDEMVWLKTPEHKIFWTHDAVIQESHKYVYKSDFINKSGSAYNAARENGWLAEITWLKNKKKPHDYWTKEKVFEESKKYTNKKDFEKNAKGAYIKAMINNWLDNMTWLKPLPLGPVSTWTKEAIIEESKKYSSRTEFAINSPTAYNHAREDKSIFKEMPWLIEKKKPDGYWDDKSIVMNEGKKYKSRTAFANGSYSAWKKAKETGWIEEMTWFKK